MNEGKTGLSALQNFIFKVNSLDPWIRRRRPVQRRRRIVLLRPRPPRHPRQSNGSVADGMTEKLKAS